MDLTAEWHKRFDAAQADPLTTDAELRELTKMGLDIVTSGFDSLLPYIYEEHFPEASRKLAEQVMANIPLLREINSIV